MRGDLNKKAERVLTQALQDPSLLGLRLDRQGWASVPQILRKVSWLTQDLIFKASQRGHLELSADGQRIKTPSDNQPNLESVSPPLFLFYGAPQRELQSILRSGIQGDGESQVELQDEESDAQVSLRVSASEMSKDGFTFFKKERAWLVSHVPVAYLHLC